MGHPRRPGPRSGPRRVGHGRRPGPRTRRPNGPRRCVWAISMPCALPDHIMRMDQWSTCRTDHAAHAKAHVRAGIADHPDGPRSIRRTNQIRGPRESPCGGRPRGPPLVHGPGRTMASLSTGPRSKDHMGRSAGGPGSCGPWPESPPPSGRSPQTHMERSHAHRAARPGPVPHPRQSTSRLPTVDVSPFGRSRHPPGAPCPASVRQPAPNKQRHNRHIREIKPDMKTSTQTDEKARHRNQKQRRQNQEPTQPATRYDAIRKPKKKHIPMQSPKEMDFLHPPPRGGRLSAERQRF